MKNLGATKDDEASSPSALLAFAVLLHTLNYRHYRDCRSPTRAAELASATISKQRPPRDTAPRRILQLVARGL